MAKVIVTAEVEDAAKWEEGFRTHGDLFRSQTTTKLDYGITEGNRQVDGLPASIVLDAPTH